MSDWKSRNKVPYTDGPGVLGRLDYEARLRSVRPNRFARAAMKAEGPEQRVPGLMGSAFLLAQADHEAAVVAAEAWSEHEDPRLRQAAAYILEWTFDPSDERMVAVAEVLGPDPDDDVRS